MKHDFHFDAGMKSCTYACEFAELSLNEGDVVAEDAGEDEDGLRIPEGALPSVTMLYMHIDCFFPLTQRLFALHFFQNR